MSWEVGTAVAVDPPWVSAGEESDPIALAALSLHEADTTLIHGIVNTANLVLTDDARLTDQRVPTDNSVTSAKIADGAILNADINASAAIAATKISGTALTLAGGTITGPLTVARTGQNAAFISTDTNAGTSSMYLALYRTSGGARGSYLGFASGGNDNLTWANETATGAIVLQTASVIRFTLSTTSLSLTLPILEALGSASAPSYSFTGDPNTGVFSPLADEVAFTAGGVIGARFNALGNLVFGLGVAGAGGGQRVIAVENAAVVPSTNPANGGVLYAEGGALKWRSSAGQVSVLNALVNADVDAAAAIAESKLALASDAAAGTASRRTLGTGALQAAAGNDPRFTDTRAPTAGSVVDASVSATAEIAVSKLADGAANDTLVTAADGTTVAWVSGLTNSHIAAAAAIANTKLDTALARGRLGYAQVTAAQTLTNTGVETDLTSLSVLVTVGTSRRIRITGQGIVSRTVADGVTVGYIKEGATFHGTWHQSSPSAATEFCPGQMSTIITPTSGDHTYKLTLQRLTGTGNVVLNAAAAAPAFILVEDIGPV